MALSNMANEPRREIIETIFGIIAFVILLIFPVWFGHYAAANWGLAPWWCASISGLLIEVIGVPLVIVTVIFIHFIGEEVCGLLDGIGLDPRPKQRYRR